MEIDISTVFLLPAGLGLLGFVEPCTIGGHLLFLDSQNNRNVSAKIRAVSIFIIARAIVTGLAGAAIAMLAQKLIAFQTGMWLVFGFVYLLIGLGFVTGRAGLIKQKISLAPDSWKRASSPAILGLAFGLNIPACAAPIMFGLLGLAASSSTIVAGFAMMFVFGFFLSAPLAIFAVFPGLAAKLEKTGQRLKKSGWIIGLVFIGLGIWSIWFGLYVNPADWSGQ